MPTRPNSALGTGPRAAPATTQRAGGGIDADSPTALDAVSGPWFVLGQSKLKALLLEELSEHAADTDRDLFSEQPDSWQLGRESRFDLAPLDANLHPEAFVIKRKVEKLAPRHEGKIARPTLAEELES
jgi:hypothetical protein